MRKLVLFPRVQMAVLPWMAAIACANSAPSVAALPPVPPPVEEEEILVIGERVRATKIDYNVGRGKILYCRARDEAQDALAVWIACQLTRQCIHEGAKTNAEVSVCVNARLAKMDEESQAEGE